MTRPKLLPRHFRRPDAFAVKLLIVVHRHRDAQQSPGELERGVIMRHRAGAVAPDIEPGPMLLPAMGRGRKAAKTRGIAFGLQVVLGTLVNAILNDPGPLSIHDDEMEVRLSYCLLQLLEAEMKAGPRRMG
jgi:hypothetical protein